MDREGEFKANFKEKRLEDKLYLFLQNVFRLYPEDRFHTLIKECSKIGVTDESIYSQVQSKLSEIKPVFADFTYALPSLFKQKREIVRQTLQLLGDVKTIRGYMEIGTDGRYVSRLKKVIRFESQIILVNETEPGFSPVHILEREQFRKLGIFLPLNDYAPFSEQNVANQSLELVTCFIGLHHIKLDNLHNFIRSIHRILKPGGWFILRDHDCTTPEMKAFVSLIHSVFNLGIGESWNRNCEEFRHFRPLADWIEIITKLGFRVSDERLTQNHDPTDNVLIKFTRT